MDNNTTPVIQQSKPNKPSAAEKRLKLIILISGLLLLILVLTVSGLRLTSTPTFCSSCHEMTPEYVTWEVSSHSQLACTNCHIEPGVKNFVVHKVKSLKQVYYHATKTYLLPIEVPEPIKNEVCEQCHDMKTRVVTTSGDIKIPHDKHLAQDIACVDCHSGVAHGNIATRQETIDGDFDRWTVAMGEAQMAHRFTIAKMQTCMECHKERKAATTCETCHKKIVQPANHQSADWVGKGEHGRTAIADIDGCNRCHSITKEDRSITGLNKVANYARTNSYCFECHSKLPQSHDGGWRANHGTKAGGAERQNCLVCHSEQKPLKTDKAAKTYCQQCHKSQHANFNRNTHPIKLDTGTKISTQCAGCHNVKLCTTCHTIPGLTRKQPA